MKIVFFLFHIGIAVANLLVADDKNFKNIVLDSNKVTLVDFYADWCRHCKNLMPVIEQVAEIFKDMEDVQVVKINGDSNGRKMSRKYKIPGYPALLLFQDGSEPIEFNGSRDAESISNFIQLASGLRLKSKNQNSTSDQNYRVVSLDESTTKDFLKDSNVVLAIASMDDPKLADIEETMSELANQVFAREESIKFAQLIISGENVNSMRFVVDELKAESLPSLQIFKNGSSVLYYGDMELSQILHFVNDEMGFSRAASGELFANAGRIISFDKMIKESTQSEDLLSHIDEISSMLREHGREALIDQGRLHWKDDVSMIDYYLHVLRKPDSQDFISQETARLESLLENNWRDLTEDALEYARKRLNILKGATR